MQYLKSRPDDTVVQSSFQFITSALNALKNKNPLTETFLVQLDVDTEGMSLDGSQGPVRRDSNLNTRVVSAYASTILYRLDLFTFFFFFSWFLGALSINSIRVSRVSWSPSF